MDTIVVIMIDKSWFSCFYKTTSVVSVIRYISVSISILLLAMYFNSVSIIVLQSISVSISIRQVFQFQFCYTSISIFISVIEFFLFILCGIKKQIDAIMSFINCILLLLIGFLLEKSRNLEII